MNKKNGMKKLTLKQARWLKEYFRTGSGTKAAMKAYDCSSIVSAWKIASENYRKLQDRINIWMDIEGLNERKLVRKVNEATEAKKVIKSFTEPDYTVPDHNVRLKAVEIAGRWMGLEKSHQNFNFTKIDYNINYDGSRVN